MFKILTVGWDPGFAQQLLAPVAARTGIQFAHGLVGDAARIAPVATRHPNVDWLPLGKAADDPLPAADHALLASLESIGVPTVRSMIRGDQVLRYRDPEEALAYLTLLAGRLREAFARAAPDVVLGNFDSAHAALSLAVAKSMGIPWVAMAFSVIPDNLTWFCNGMTPEALVPARRPVDEGLQREAAEVLDRYRSRNVRIMAYRPPESLTQRVRQVVTYVRNAGRRVAQRREMGVDRFTYPTLPERMRDVGRRSLNRLRLPAERMLIQPPAGSYLFFPLHMAPESSVDTWAPMYQDQLGLAAQLAMAVPADVEVVVKLHFSDPDNYAPVELARLMNLPRVRIAHPAASSRAFIERALLVVGIQGTASLEAALVGKPVLLFGDSPYQHFPRSERAARPDGLYAQLRRMLSLPPATDAEIIEAFAAYMARYRPGRINDWNIPLEPADFDRLGVCFDELRSYVASPGTRAGWYSQPPFTAHTQRGE